MTHTNAELKISSAAFLEIWELLGKAGYHHAFREGAIDMNGITITRKEPPPLRPGYIGISGIWFRSDAQGNRLEVLLEVNGEWRPIASLKGDGQGIISHIIEPVGIWGSIETGNVTLVS